MRLFKKKENTDEKLKRLILDLHANRFELAKEKKILNTFMNEGSVILTDMDNNTILYMNRNAEKELGENLIGTKCYETIHNKKEACEFCNSQEVIEREGEIVSSIFSHKKRLYFVKTAYLKIINGKEKHIRLDKKTDITELIPEIKKYTEE